MRKIFAATILCIAILLTGCSGNLGGTNDSYKPKDPLIIGIDDEFAPIAFHNKNGELIGFDVDLAKEAAKRLGVKFVFKSIDWDNKREELSSGNIDLIWNGLDITEERKEYMIFTRPYMDDRQILLVKRYNTHNISSENDLAGKIVGVQTGATAEDYLDMNIALKDSLREYKKYEKFFLGVDALKNDEIDVFICDELVARYEMNIHPDIFEVVDVKIGGVAEMAIGFRKGEVELRDAIQAVFDDMVADGTAAKISEKWFQADVIKQN